MDMTEGKQSGLWGLVQRYHSVLRGRDLRWIAGGHFAYMFGGEVGHLARFWLVLQLSGSAAALGGIVLMTGLTRAVGGLLAGMALDRFDRRRLVASGNLFLSITVIVVPLLYWRGELALWHIFLAGFAQAVISTLTSLGMQTLTPAYVPAERLDTANAVLSLTGQVSLLSGPAIGGIVVAWLGAPSALTVTTACYIITAVAFTRLSMSPREEGGAAHLGPVWADFVEGIRYVLRHQGLLTLAVLTLGFNFAYGPLQVAIPIIAQDVLRVGAQGYGILWTVFAAGWMIGGVVAGAVDWQRRTAQALAAIPVLWGLTSVFLAFTSSLAAAAAVMFFAGLVFAPYGILSVGARQRTAPDRLRGRVLAAHTALAGAGEPLGAVLGGSLIGILGVPIVIVAASCLSAATGIAIYAHGGLNALEVRQGETHLRPHEAN